MYRLITTSIAIGWLYLAFRCLVSADIAPALVCFAFGLEMLNI